MNTQPPGARRRVWLTGFLFLVVIASIAVLSARAGIEAELRSQAADRLAEAGYSWLDVSVSGRDVILQGAVFSEQDQERAETALRDIWGVGSVESRLQIAVRERPYVFSISRSSNKVKLRGSAPSEDARKTIIGLANANFPGLKISAKLNIDPNIADAERWLTGVGFALGQLKNVSAGRSILADAELSFEGRAAKPGAYEALMRGFREETPQGITVSQLRVQPPEAESFTWTIQIEDGNVVLGGYAPSEMAQASMVVLAQRLFPQARIIDTTVIADGEPQGWWRAARLALEAMDYLRSGSVTLGRSEVKLEGIAKNFAARKAISALKDAWPSGFDFKATVRLSGLEPNALGPRNAPTAKPPAAPL